MTRAISIIAAAALILTNAIAARADHRIGDICRIKGQEENILVGMGLVVGLKGTGDSDMKSTQQALGHFMEMLGHSPSAGKGAQANFDQLKGAKNVALVYVTAIVPPGGVQQGDNLDCIVSAVGAKSLDGGNLMLTEMKGPVPGDKTIYALAHGLVSVDDKERPQTGRVPLGCQIERKIGNEFVTKDGKLLLVMNKDHAAFQTAASVENVINNERDFAGASSAEGIARAIDQLTIEVRIPPNYEKSPTLFAALLLDTRLAPVPTDTRVIVNERKQALIVGADVEIGPVAVMHKNRLITVGDVTVNEAVAFDLRSETSQQKPKLKALVDALNMLKVPTSDVIDIVKMLKHKRALFGELIIE